MSQESAVIHPATLLERDAVVVSQLLDSISAAHAAQARKGQLPLLRAPAPRPVTHAGVLKHDAASGSRGRTHGRCFISALSRDGNCSQRARGRKHPPLNHSLPSYPGAVPFLDFSW